MKKFAFLCFAFLFLFFNCNKDNENNLNLKPSENIVKKSDNQPKISFYFKIFNQENISVSDTIKFIYIFKADQKIDSIKFYFENKFIANLNVFDSAFKFFPETNTVGPKNLKFVVFLQNSKKSFQKKINLCSDTKPKWFSYKVIASYPHDPNAYTQGLLFDNGILYESTGLENKSSIRKVDLKTGEIIYSYENPPNIFGEGLAMLENKLYQITWQNHIAYVYDKNSFEVIDKFNYQTEGWGLTTDGSVLYMTDGSNIIYVRDPNTFFVVRKIYVCDDKKPVNLLNELEFIEGKIWANIYTKDYIAVIDPNSGKVEKYINLSGILPKSYKNKHTDVLNGIAYDKTHKKIYVTGKNWPLLFEIELK